MEEANFEEWNKNADEISKQVNNVGVLLEERGKIYGDIRDNMVCAAELQRVVNIYMQPYHGSMSLRDMSGVLGCINMILHKVSRAVTGDIHYEDNWKDIGGYAELARKIVTGEIDARNHK